MEIAREIVSRTVESSAGRRSEISAVSARTSVGCSRSRTWRSSSAESCGCSSRNRLSRSCVSISCQSTVGLATAGAGGGGSAGANTGGGATVATEPNRVDGGGAGRGAKLAASSAGGGEGRRTGANTRRSCGSGSLDQAQASSRSVNTVIVGPGKLSAAASAARGRSFSAASRHF